MHCGVGRDVNGVGGRGMGEVEERKGEENVKGFLTEGE